MKGMKKELAADLLPKMLWGFLQSLRVLRGEKG